MNRIKGLDTLRAIAVLCVVMAHWGPFYDDTHPAGRFLQALIIPDGAAAVYLFFVLSGFLITGILLNARASNDGNRLFTVKNFFVRRALRIFPIYYLLIFLLYFTYPDVRQNIGYFATYTSNILCYQTNTWNSASHTWTLAVEEQFYIVWPWLVLFINRKYLGYLFLASILTGIVSTWFVTQTKIEPFLVFNCLDAFGIGGLYALARTNITWQRQFEKVISICGPLLLLPYIYWRAGTYTHSTVGIFLYKTVDSLLAVWIITLVVNNKKEWVRRYILENRVLNFIGIISYGVYLYHPYIPNVNPYIASFISKHLQNAAWRAELTRFHTLYVVDFILLLFVCWLSYVVIEQPLLNLKKWFRYRKATASSLQGSE